jgi:hypothetical protein
MFHWHRSFIFILQSNPQQQAFSNEFSFVFWFFDIFWRTTERASSTNNKTATIKPATYYVAVCFSRLCFCFDATNYQRCRRVFFW